jgi:hypothetical protein
VAAQITVEQIQAIEPTLSVPGYRWDVKEPRPYQLTDAAAAILRERFIVAEYPGAGKKIIAILAAIKLFELGKAECVLIVSLGADVDQWVEDINEVVEPEFVVQKYRGTPKERARKRGEDVSFRVTTYNTAIADWAHLVPLHQCIVLDEVSYLKNPDTTAHMRMRGLCAPNLEMQAQAITDIWDHEEQKLVVKAEEKGQLYVAQPCPDTNSPGSPVRYVWGLTATPLETGPVDIFSLFWIMFSHLSPLGINLAAFKKWFCVVVTSKVKLPSRNKPGKHFHVRIEKVKGAKPEMVPELTRRIREFYIRHPFETIEKYLPPIEIIPIWLELGTRQRNRLKEITDGKLVADFVFKQAGRRITEKEINAAIKLFYQLRCCDGLTSLPGQSHRDSAKMQWVMDKLTGELGNEKVIFFSRFHQPHLDLIPKLDELGIPWARISGNETEDEATAARLSFWDPEGARILLITEKARYALNLQVAKYGIAYNTLFNPKKLEQLYGRNRRPGGGDHVIWYHTLIKDSPEEAQWRLLREREQLFGDIFGLAEELFDTLTPEEQDQLVAGQLTA